MKTNKKVQKKASPAKRKPVQNKPVEAVKPQPVKKETEAGHKPVKGGFKSPWRKNEKCRTSHLAVLASDVNNKEKKISLDVCTITWHEVDDKTAVRLGNEFGKIAVNVVSEEADKIARKLPR